MRSRIGVAFILCMSAFAQISVDESATRARLVNNGTTVSLAIDNRLGKPVDTRIDLQWLDPAGANRGQAQHTFTAPPGASTLDVPLTPGTTGNQLFYRLHYTVSPDGRNLTRFLPVRGVIGFTQIAEHAFRLTASVPGAARIGEPCEFRVVASHPVTLAPISGVEIQRDGKVLGRTGADGIATVRVTPTNTDSDGLDLEFTGRLGDLEQEAEVQVPVLPNEVRIYTDKPIYQPGQTVHARILALSSSGKARANAEYLAEIRDGDSMVAFSAQLTTSRFGIAHTGWEIPANAKSGTYEILLRDAESNHDFRREIEVRRYELPSFRVMAKPGRSFYLPGQNATIDISAEYLFGKPLTAGKVRISEHDSDDAIQEGTLSADGRFRTTLDLAGLFGDGDNARFTDHRLVAYVTDAVTNRTEKREFDVRISREPLHVYVLNHVMSALPFPLYIATYSADGNPVAADVDVFSNGRIVASGRSNRYGVARVPAPAVADEELTVRARTANGEGHETVQWNGAAMEVQIETDRALYRAGQPILCTVRSTRKDLRPLLIAWDDRGNVLHSGLLTLKDGAVEHTIPYDARLRGAISLGISSVSGSTYHVGRTILYPGSADLRITATPGKATYAPGDDALVTIRTVADKGPVQSALGVAVVDESVFERVAADASNKRSWFGSHEFRHNERRVGGFSAGDLLRLDPASIDADLQLVAEALLAPQFTGPYFIDTFIDDLNSAYRDPMALSLTNILHHLDSVYTRTLEYPRDAEALQRMLFQHPGLDPWQRPYRPTFGFEGTKHVLRYISDGPDKRPDTEDDLVALAIERAWFAPTGALIRQALARNPDYPATPAEVQRVLAEAGLQFDRLHDPWGSPMRIAVTHRQTQRIVTVSSTGPDRRFGTADDVKVMSFEGTYFKAAAEKLNSAMGTAAEFPASEQQLRERLQSAGFGLDMERDPWGHPYYATLHIENSFINRSVVYSYADYQGMMEDRQRLVPSWQRMLVAQVRSTGEDGIRDTYDDFTLVRFQRLTSEDVPPPPEALPAPPPATSLVGQGTIEGYVMDMTGAVIPNATVILDEIYQTRTNEVGKYSFRGIPARECTVRAASQGFRETLIGRVPSAPGEVTRLDIVLEVGSVTESVMISADAPLLETSAASMAIAVSGASGTATSTPRVREYFPETLYWAPEVVTNAAGQAELKFKLADSITSWRVAVIGSTLDGRIAETVADIRAFQPFFVDLDPPQVLTVGDEIALPTPIRNYTRAAQSIDVTATAPAAIQISGAAKRGERIAAGSVSNTVVTLKAVGASDGARLRMTARTKAGGDAIEKPIVIHPDGEPVSRTVSDLLSGGRTLRLDVPANAIAGSVRAEVKIYPNVLAHVIESMEALLKVPTGCAEQTISSAYPNLLFLRALKSAGIQGHWLESRARRNLELGYRRLLGYRHGGGGFGYWVHGDSNVALTAYAIAFLEDASELITVDPNVLGAARAYLAKQSSEDRSVQSLALRSLVKAGPQFEGVVVARLGELARNTASLEDPYTQAVFALAALEARRANLAETAIDRLRQLAKEEQDSVYWPPARNTPYHGWGRAGAIETTALVVTALSRWQAEKGPDPRLSMLVDRGVAFLLSNKDSRGTWFSGQATVRVFEALMLGLKAPESSLPASADVLVNGEPVGKVAIPGTDTLNAPVLLDVSRWIKPGGTNEIALPAPLSGTAAHFTMQAQFVAEWYETWAAPRTSPDFTLQVRYDKTEAQVNDLIRCSVKVSRPAFRGYGMMIAEAGLPPGAEVDRGTLSALLEDYTGVQSFEVAPDRIVFYIWPRAADLDFSFAFRPRYPMKARTAPSVLYDYYNPEARAAIAPVVFTVH